MENVFRYLLDMSITAGWLVLAVLVLRLVLRNAPRWIHCALWALVAVRLICPVSIESALSWIPSIQSAPVNTVLSGPLFGSDSTPAADGAVTPVTLAVSDTPVASASVTVAQLLTILWLVGVAVLALYAVVTTLRLRRRVRESVHLRDNLWQSDRIATPFILGVIRPRIYLPTTLAGPDIPSVVAHEQAHLKRGDHWWKPLGFVLLTVYWFHPLLWVGYVLLCRDIEAACDQKVIRDMDLHQRKAYSMTILSCSAPRHLVTVCPLAFGETAVKSRVKSVLSYKKPAFWLVLAAVVALVVSSVCLLTDPPSIGANKQPPQSEEPGDIPAAVTEENTFTGKVLKVTDGSMLMECYDKEKFSQVWVGLASFPDLHPQVGEEYTVTHNGMVMESFPPQITAEKVTHVPAADPGFISETRAIEIAADYWGIQPGDRDPDTGFVFSIHAMETPTADNPYYRMMLRWLVEVDGGTGNFSTVDTVYVHAETGEVAVPGA